MKNTIVGIIIGLCVAVTGFHIWFYYNVAKQTTNNTQAIAEIVSFIKQNTTPQNPVTQVTPVVK